MYKKPWAGLQVQVLNDLYRGEGNQAGAGFGKRTVTGAGVVTADEDLYEGAAPRKSKKNMSRVQCKACGQVPQFPPLNDPGLNELPVCATEHCFEGLS